jgi:hypothetical protein
MSEQDPDVWDEEREEAEARERYGFMDSGVKWEPKPYKLTPKQEKYRDYMRRKVAGEGSIRGRNGVNYHGMDELPDEHLPDLDFIRCDNLFTARTANAYLQTPLKTVTRRRLFGDMWHEGEITLLFADTGLGKSALAVQIARALAGGETLDPFPMDTEPQRVLYFDFELTDEQFAARYSDPDATACGTKSVTTEPECVTKSVTTESGAAEPLFPDNFIRCAPKREDSIMEEDQDHYSFLISSLAEMVEFSRARVVIVDNITWLAASTEHSTAAQRLMRTLVDMRNKLGISILVLAHTPKIRRGLPIELKHLQGSKMLANFADNIVGMGKSSLSNDLRYLKPLKQRSSAERLSQDTVHVLRLQRQGRMLGFTFAVNETEARHVGDYLKGTALADAIRVEQVKRAIEMSNAGDSVREIAAKLGISRATASRYVQDKGPIDQFGKKAHFCLSVSHAHAPPVRQTSHFSGNSDGEEVPVDP